MECIATRMGLLLLIAALSACASKNQAPFPPQTDYIEGPAKSGVKPRFEPVPTALPPSKGGNPESYEVFGETYYVMPTSAGYREQGMASWYGPGFHGKLTSSRETYDMNGMTAAHKSLPIPTFVRVTHLENGRSIVLKVNDRGPFAHDRIIDLSRAAAEALDVIGAGTAPVDVVALQPWQTLPGRGAAPTSIAQPEVQTLPAAAPFVSYQPDAQPPPVAYSAPEPITTSATPINGGEVLQLAAFSSKTNAIKMVENLMHVVELPLWVDSNTNLHRVRTGPVKTDEQVASITSLLAQMGMGPPQVIRN